MKTNPLHPSSYLLALLFATVAALMPAKAELANPLFSLDASALTEGDILAPLPNGGSLAGNFGTDGTTVNVATTAGRKSFTFTGSNRLKADFAAPGGIAGNGTYTVVATVLNPAIDSEEAYCAWSRRFPEGGFNAAQFNYGSNPTWGAVTHWGGPDMGFSSVPPANLWQTIAVTFDGATEKVYVNGDLNAQEDKTLNMYTGDPVFIGCSYNFSFAPELGFSGSVASVKVYDEALSASQVIEAMGLVSISGTVANTGSEPISGATVYYSLSTDPVSNPLGTATTDVSGNYSFGIPQNSGPYYIAAAKSSYITSGNYSPAPSVTTTSVSGINFALTLGAPLIDLDASNLADGALTTWANAGTITGDFGNDGTTVNVETVAGIKAVTFTGGNRMKSDFFAPSAITGNGSFTVIAKLYNPAIAAEEAYLTWAQRGTPARCGQFNFGSHPDFGAAAHWAGADIGFNPVPPADSWQTIAMTFDGITEKIYVNGVPNNKENKTLDLWPGQPVMLGASYGNSDGTGVGQNFSGSMSTLKVYGSALSASQISVLLGTISISGQVSSDGYPVAGATVYYKLSANAADGPLGTVTTDVNGNYTIGLLANSGTYYLAAGKSGFITSADSAPQTVTSSNITGVDISLAALPAISGNISNTVPEVLYNAAVTINTSSDGGTTLDPVQTVYTDIAGDYIAYVDANTTYYLTVRKSAHADPAQLTVAVAEVDVSGKDFVLTKAALNLLVDLQASSLPTGVQTTATTWANTGTLGGSFTADNAYAVTTVAGRPAVDLTGTPDVTFTSSWQTNAVTWPSALADTGDVQYSVVGWIQAPASTGTFVSWSNGTAPANGRTFSPSWMSFRYNNDVPWGAGDHGFSHWIGWTGTNTNSPTEFPPLATWHMIVHTYDGLSEALYVDGVKKSTTGSESILRTFNPVVNSMRIGNNLDGWDVFKGYINRLQVFDQPLSATDVTQLWNAGALTGTAYDTWLIDYPTLAGNDRAPDADPDFDGVANGIEFMMGTSPADGASRSVPSVVLDGGGNLVVTFQRVDAAEEFPVVVESSANLQPPWTEIAVPNDAITGPPVTVIDNGTAPDSITVIVPGSPDSKKFARVKIVIPFVP